MIGKVIKDEFFINRDWPVAVAVAMALLAVAGVPIMIYKHWRRRADGAKPMNGPPLVPHHGSVFGFAFLYIPILSLIVFLLQQVAARRRSGAASRRSGTGAVQERPDSRSRSWLSVKIGASSRHACDVLGTMAGMALARLRAFAGRTLLCPA